MSEVTLSIHLSPSASVAQLGFFNRRSSMTPQSALLVGKPIRGWLAALVFALVLLGPGAAYNNYTETHKALAAINERTPPRQLVVATHTVLLVAYALLSIYTAHILWEKKTHAVATAKMNLIALAVLSVAAAFCVPAMAAFPPQAQLDFRASAFGRILRALFIYGIPYLYLSRSWRVKDTYTPDLPDDEPDSTSPADS